MKVKISYNVDLDDVPDIINGILSECKQNLISEANNLKFYLHDLNKMTHQIETVRSCLSLIDSQLEDVIHLSSGWTDVQESEEDLSGYEDDLPAVDDEEI